MLYSRADIVELVQAESEELHSILIAIMWFASRGDTNLIDNDRYGLCQVELNQARTIGFTNHPNELLEPHINIRIAAQLIHKYGLLVFLGRNLAAQLPRILQLATYLDGNRNIKAERKSSFQAGSVGQRR